MPCERSMVFLTSVRGPNAAQALILRSLLTVSARYKDGYQMITRKMLAADMERLAEVYGLPMWIASKQKISSAIIALSEMGLLSVYGKSPQLVQIAPEAKNIALAIVQTYNLFAAREVSSRKRADWVEKTKMEALV